MIPTKLIHGKYKRFSYEGRGIYFDLIENRTGKSLSGEILKEFRDKNVKITIEVEE